MIHHLSIAARDPMLVAGVFAELLGGVAIPFPPCPGAWIALACDAHGSAVEVYPAGVELRPNGVEGAEFARRGAGAEAGAGAGYLPVHFALATGLDVAGVEAIARRESWRSFVCNRGGDFNVVEVWIENRILVELLPPDFARQYLAFTSRFRLGDDPKALMASHERLQPA